MKTLSAIILLGTILLPQYGFSMSKGPVNYVQSVGKSQSQFAVADEKDGIILLRGHAAEVLFKNIKKEPRVGQEPGVVVLGNKVSETTIAGTTVNCSELKNKSKSEYACSLKLNEGVYPVAYRETYSSTAFNWGESYGGPTFFNGKKNAAQGRAIASVGSTGPIGSGDAKVYFVTPKDKKKQTENVLVLVNGKAAERMYNVMAAARESKPFSKGTGTGYRGDGVACVHADGVKKVDSMRCSFTVALSNGDIVKDYNPLFSK